MTWWYIVEAAAYFIITVAFYVNLPDEAAKLYPKDTLWVAAFCWPLLVISALVKKFLNWAAS